VKNRPVLSLFPGIGLLDYAFEAEGFTVFRGPDILWGGDIRRFHVKPGYFEGVIGGPPCQSHSTASQLEGTQKEDLIPEYIRIVEEAAPLWSVMENVKGTIGHEAIPADWQACLLKDCDVGGLTKRVRAFYTWPFWLMTPPLGNGMNAAYSVMATSWKRGSSDSQYVKDKGFLPGDLPIQEYARLQGADEIGARLLEHKANKSFAVHVLGNGVPIAMGKYIAQSVIKSMYGGDK